MARRDTMPRFGSVNLLDDQIDCAKVLISGTVGLDGWRNAVDPETMDGADVYASSLLPAAIALANDSVLIGNAGGAAAACVQSGDVISTDGVAAIQANVVVTGDMATSLVQYAGVEISSAEILALFTTAKELVAAPAAGNFLEFISLQLAYDYGTAVYTIGTATNFQVQYTNIAGVAVSTTQAVTGMIDQATDQIRSLDKLEASVTPAVAAALVLTIAVANPTNGDGVIHAKVAYRVHATGL